MNKNEIITQNAIKYVKENSKKIIQEIVGNKASFGKNKLFSVSVFMAGSPGAGKTEMSKKSIEIIERDPDAKAYEKITRIDPDDIREKLPLYNGKNSHLFQAACSIAVDRIHDYVLKNNFDFLLDGTFSNYNKARENIYRSVKRKRLVFIYYVYQDPIVAWGFTKKREQIDGRHIPKDAFIDHFFNAKENVSKIKKEFKDLVKVRVIERNLRTNYSKIGLDVDIDNYIKIGYTKKELNKLLLW